MRDIRPALLVGGCSMLAKISRHCNKSIPNPFGAELLQSLFCAELVTKTGKTLSKNGEKLVCPNIAVCRMAHGSPR
jgi:hypothetical protein